LEKDVNYDINNMASRKTIDIPTGTFYAIEIFALNIQETNSSGF
jgi:hypothetical protein